MKNGNLHQKIKSAKKEEKVAYDKYYAMELAKLRELEEATRPIIEKYDPILKALEEDAHKKGSKVWDIGYPYRDCGTFPRFVIVNIVSLFLSYIEGEKYVPFSSSETNQNSIIIREEIGKRFDDMDYDTLEALYKEGDLIMLSEGYGTHVTLHDNIGNPMFRLGSFNYLREFFNRLIQYRAENDKIKDISTEELYTFMCHFISSHPELAQKNKVKRDQMLAKQSEEDTLISECQKLEVALGK